MIRLAIVVAATAVASLLAAAPASATESCHTIHGPFPTVEMCINIPVPIQ
ncbi:MAG: hypothetical protein QOC82_2475 [Frankiaceae bacterium]|jgi:hypothetical protein|nr:hypothetical protein [Frankiaceae bacterium]